MLDYRQYMEIPSLLICTLAYCIWLSFTVVSDTISPQVWPLVWLFSTIAIIINPAPIFHREARWWIIRSTVRVLTAGLVRVDVRQQSSFGVIRLTIDAVPRLLARRPVCDLVLYKL